MDRFSPGNSARPFLLDRIATTVLDDRGQVVHWSPAAAELSGRETAEVIGTPVWRLLADSSQQHCPLEAGIALGGTATLQCSSGDVVEIAFQVVPVTASYLLALAVPTRWVDDWEQGALLLRGLLAQDRIGVSIHDEDLRLVRTNIEPTLYGNSTPPSGGPAVTAFSPHDAEPALRQVLATGVPLVGYQQQRPSPQVRGRQPPVSLSAVRLEDVRGHPAGAAALWEDATTQQRITRDLQVMHEASSRIGRSLDVQRTAQDVVDVLVPALGDLGWVNLAEAVLIGDEPPKLLGGGNLYLRRAAQASVTGAFPAELIQAGEPLPTLPDSVLLWAVQDGRAVIGTRATAQNVLSAELFPLAVPDRGHSTLWAPLSARGLLLGFVVIWRTDQPAPFQQGDADLITEIATRAALSVDNARRYTREHRAAVALQESLLPQAITEIPAAQTVGEYRPAGGGNVSGDWYDVLPLSSLRAALVIGDVFGHGLRASAMMGRLRTAIHTLSDVEFEPEELLTHLDDTVAQLAAEADASERDTIGATCLYALYDPVTRDCVLASAGHPPPLLVRPDGSCRPIELSPGPPLGVGGMPFESTTINLEPGSVLAFYTDGLIERGDRDPEAGMQHLIDLLAEYCVPGRPLEAVTRSMLAGADDPPPRDDIALLLARTRALADDDTAAWEFSADPAVVARARGAVSHQLALWGLLDEAAFTTELVASELITNAVRYAGGTIGLRLIRDAAVLICEVTDSSNTQPRMRRARTTDEGGRGLFLVAQFTQRWGSRYGRSGKTIWAEQRLTTGSPT